LAITVEFLEAIIFVELSNVSGNEPEFHFRLNNKINCGEVKGKSVLEIKITAMMEACHAFPYHCLQADGFIMA
jgi:hypothetical protein